MPNFHGDEAKFSFFFEKKNLNGRLKKTELHCQKLSNFRENIYRLVLGLVELIDVKGINMTQPIWPSGCPT